MNNLIQWPTAKYWTAQWNPVIGCKPCSPACENCYAAAWAKRFHKSFAPHVSSQMRPPRSGVVFCGNMTDLFGEWLSDDDVSIIISQTYNHTPNLFLTKRTERMDIAANFDTKYGFRWFGMTAENQEWYDRRIKDFRSACLWHGWLSAEPLLGPIDLGLRYIAPEDQPFGWLVIGCESGPNRRPCKLEWVESIVEQCRAANVPVFVKQLDIGGKYVTDINKFPAHLRIRQVPWAKEGETK